MFLGEAFREVFGGGFKNRRQNICWFRVVKDTHEVLVQEERLLHYWTIRLTSEWNMYDTVSKGKHNYSTSNSGIYRVSGKRNENKTKKAQGVVLMADASRIWKFVKSNLLRVYDVDLLGRFNDFSQVSSFVRSTAVCSATFRRDVLLQLLNPCHTISAVIALQAGAQLEVARPIFCVPRDEHLSIDRPVCPLFAWHASSCCCSLRLLLYTAAIIVAATS